MSRSDALGAYVPTDWDAEGGGVAERLPRRFWSGGGGGPARPKGGGPVPTAKPRLSPTRLQFRRSLI